MSTLNELVFDQLNTIRTRNISDDDSISERHLQFLNNSARATLVIRQLNKNRLFYDQNLIQSLGCVPVEITDTSICCDVQTGCSIVRTVDKIPNSITVGNKNGATRVGPLDLTARPYTIISYSRAAWDTSKGPVAFKFNGYWYIKNVKALEKVSIYDIFEDPREAAKFSTCSGDSCYTDDDPYPIPAWMIDPIKEMVIQSTLKIEADAPQDKSNDANSDLKK